MPREVWVLEDAEGEPTQTAKYQHRLRAPRGPERQRRYVPAEELERCQERCARLTDELLELRKR